MQYRKLAKQVKIGLLIYNIKFVYTLNTLSK